MAGRISDVEPMGNGFGFTLKDSEDVPAVEFIYADERRARAAAKMMQAVLADAVAIAPPGGF